MQQASFGFVIADLPVVFDTEMVQQPLCEPSSSSSTSSDANGSGGGVLSRWSYSLKARTLPSSVWLFLTGNAPIPEGKVLSAYIADASVSSSSAAAPNLLFLGYVSAQCPSSKFVVPCGLSRNQFVSSSSSFSSATAAVATAICGHPTMVGGVGGVRDAPGGSAVDILLGFSLEDEATAVLQASHVGAPSQEAHMTFVMRVGAAVTNTMRSHIHQSGTWLQGADPNGSDSTIMIDPKVLDRCKAFLDKQVEHSISQFA